MEDQRARRFEAMLATHMDAAYNLAFWLTRNPDTAEDCVQEACLRALRYFDSFHGGDGRAWMLKIVRNTCYSWRQKSGNQPMSGFDGERAEDATDLSDMPLHAENPEMLVLRQAELRDIEKALLALPAEHREIIVLRELEDLSYLKIAEIVGIPIGTVMSRLSRARALLRQQLGSDGEA